MQSPIMSKATKSYMGKKLVTRRVRSSKQPRRYSKLRSRDRSRTRPRSFILSSRAQKAIQNMFMPYIEGPKMDWTVNDALYHRILK